MLWTVARCLICVHKSVMQILRWQAHVLICAAVRVPEMHKDAAPVWTKSVDAQNAKVYAIDVAAAEDYQMRLTKRQLKRIIREEYTLLKRRGLIREARLGPEIMANLDELESELMYACEPGNYRMGELTDALKTDVENGDRAVSQCELVLGVCTDPQLKREIMRFCQMAVNSGGRMYDLESDMY